MRIKLVIMLSILYGSAYADINVTQGSGKTVKTDTVSGAEYQNIKLCDGAAGSSVCFSTAPVQVLQSTVGAIITNTPNVIVLASTVGINGIVPISISASTMAVIGNGLFNVTGSTIGINGTIPVSIAASTMAVIGNGLFNVTGSTVGAVITNAPTIIQSTGGINGSTIAVTNAGGTTLAVSGTITSNQGTNPWIIGNSTSAVNVLGTVPTTVSNSTIGVVAAVPFQIQNSTIAISNAITVTLSTAGVGGSTLAVTNAVGTTLAISGNLTGNQNVTVLASTIGINGTVPATISNSTSAVVQTGPVWTIGNSTIAISNSITVTLSTAGTGGSTVAVTNAGGTTLAISGTVTANQGTPSNWLVGNSTIGVVAAVPLTVQNSTIGVVGTFTANQTVLASTVGVVNGGAVFTIGNSTIGVNVLNVPTVVQSTAGINGSTVAVTNAGGTTLVISGNLTGNQNVTVLASTVGISGTIPTTVSNSTIAVTANGFFNENSSTVGVVNGGSTFNATVLASTIGIAGTVPVSIAGSTVGVVQSGGLAWLVANSTIATVGTLSNNGVAAATNMVPVLAGVAQSQYGSNGSAYTQGRNAAVNVGTVDGLLRVSALPNITDKSYSASTTTFALAFSSMDFTAICGNVISTVAVTGLRISCTQTTAGVVPIVVTKRSTLYTGTWSTATAVAEDSNYTINNSSAIFFASASPALPQTQGTLVGYIDSYQLGCMASGTASPNDIYISPSNWRMKPIILRNANQCVGVNVQSASITGNKWTVTWQWIETNSP